MNLNYNKKKAVSYITGFIIGVVLVLIISIILLVILKDSGIRIGGGLQNASENLSKQINNSPIKEIINKQITS